MPSLPAPRGAATESLFAALRSPVHAPGPLPPADSYDDHQLALYCCYELHYRGFDEVDERWEWAPGLLAARAALEGPFESGLEQLVAPRPFDRDAAEMDLALREVADADDGPSLARF